MPEILRKSLLYLRKSDSYWRLTDSAAAKSSGGIGKYPLDIVPRLEEGHFARFDEAGLPIDPHRDGASWIHNYTTLSAFALAHWDLYVQSGDEKKLAVVMQVAEYVLATADRRDAGVLRLRSEEPGLGHVGHLSGMFQGEATSVLCRAYQATRDPRYLRAAEASLRTYDVPVQEDGVLGVISRTGAAWYEEDTYLPLRHILNGMVYSVWGAMDLHTIAPSADTERWVRRGVQSIGESVSLFDNGYWSWYDVPEQGEPYIASMMYHNLHICQLRGLYAQTGDERLLRAAERFERYADRLPNRMRALLAISKAKATRSRRKEGAETVHGVDSAGSP